MDNRSQLGISRWLSKGGKKRGETFKEQTRTFGKNEG